MKIKNELNSQYGTMTNNEKLFNKRDLSVFLANFIRKIEL